MDGIKYFIFIFFVLNLVAPFEFSSDRILENTNNPHQGQCSIITCTVNGEVLYGYNYDGHEDLEPFIQFGDHLTWSDGDISNFSKPICVTGRMSQAGPRDLYARINDDGLAMAFNSLPSIQLYIDPTKENSSAYNIPTIIDCSTIDDVISFFNEHNYFYSSQNPSWNWQEHYVDATGKAIVVGLNESGKVTITEINETQFLISANQNLAYPGSCDGSCDDSIRRIKIAKEMLQPIVANESLSVNTIRNVLEALSNEATTHSLIFNPKTLDLYVYYRFHYDKVFNFNIEEELNKLAPSEVKFYNLKEMYYNTITNTSTVQVPITTTIILGLFSFFIIIIKLKRSK